MAVTDLTNTKWLINSKTCTAGYGTFQIDFDRDEWSTYYDFYIGYGGTPDGPYPLANSVNIAPAGPDFLQENDIITITGGIDVTNSSLISWLEANATQIVEAGKMYIGTSNISKMYLGQNEVSKVYLGQDLVYEKQAPVSNATITFNLTFTTLNRIGGLYFNFDAPFTSAYACDWDVSGGWAYVGFNQIFNNVTGNAPTMPNERVFGTTSTFTIEVPIGTEIYVHGRENNATNQTLNGVSIPVDYTQAVKYTITQDTTFNISLSGEDD